MPIYEYAHDPNAGPGCGEKFEVLQSSSAPELTTCPTCGQPCHRIFSAPAAPQTKSGLLSKSNLEAKGFTQYKKAGSGVYEKTAGTGPDVINSN